MIRDRLEQLKEESKLLHASSSDSLCIITENDIVGYVHNEKTNGKEPLHPVDSNEQEDMEQDEETQFIIVPHKPAMDALFKVYSQMLEEFNTIRTNLDKMREMVAAKNSKSFNEKDFYNLRQSCTLIGGNIMNKFQSLETNLPQPDDFTTLARMKRILYYGLFQKYVDIWSEMEEFLQEYENNLKRTLRAQSRILNIELNEEEIETLVTYKQTNLYSCNILEDTEHARKTLDALTARLGDLKKLEKSLEEVHAVFIRLQTLVVEQGMVIQSIEKHYLDAQDYVEQAAEEIKEAEILHKKQIKFWHIFLIFKRKMKIIRRDRITVLPGILMSNPKNTPIYIKQPTT
ncbi:syntaxin-4-like [Musca vetustissima]|uniref:syntaxin-4-like n=1 Tax=Musca vetustissima TaxID=27455 RepID=UPI002AB7904F|nr:syntaxin-4-like [Musca vetustissima]